MGENYEEISIRLRKAVGVVFPDVKAGDIAKKLAVHVNTLNNYLYERRQPSATFLAKLVGVGIDANWVLTGEGAPLLADSNMERGETEKKLLSMFGAAELMGEVDRRVSDAIDDAIERLTVVRRWDLSGLARALRKDREYSFSDDEAETADGVTRAFWTLDGVMFWFPDTVESRRRSFREFVKLHEEVVSDKDFRVVLYKWSEDRMLRASSMD